MVRKNEDVKSHNRVTYQRTWKYDPVLWDVLIQVMSFGTPDLLNHSVRVANLAVKIAQRLGLDQKQIELIIKASLFHDIGKLGVSQKILSKPGRLTPKEYEIVKTHPDVSAALVQECSDSNTLIPILRHHHEFYCGRGYPDKISGNQIEIEARILSVADAMDAMMSDQPYRRRLKKQQIITELQQYTGIQFDPAVVEPAIKILEEMNISE